MQTYTARQGETASGIAAKFGVSLDWLKEYNPLKLNKGKVTTPQTLVVPLAANGEAKKSTAPKVSQAEPARKPAKPAMRTHTVRKGDTLARLAKRYNVQVADIRRWNENADPLVPGTRLSIPILPS